MIQGGSENGFPRAVHWAKKCFCLQSPDGKLTQAITEYLKMQADCGVDAFNIDSWQSLCPVEHSWDWSIKWINPTIDGLESQVPIILYAKSSSERIDNLMRSKADGLSISEDINLPSLRKKLLPYH